MIKVLLKDISTGISSGITPLRSNPDFWSSQDIPWVKTEQLGTKHIWDSNEKVSKAALEKTSLKLNPVNSLSVAMYGEGRTRGSVSILKKEVTTNQACCNIAIDKSKADYEYVYYFLKTQYNELRNLSSGVRKNLNSNDIKNFEIRLPNELKTQKKIARVLATLDDKIELNNKINAELEAMAKLIYDYWFVQFDFPDADGKPYKSSGGKMVYNQILKRETPLGWEVKELEIIANITTGKLDSNAEVLNGEFPFFTCSKEPTTINSYSFDGDVILIAGNNAQGNFHVNRYSGKFNAYQRTYVVTAKNKKHLNYLYQVLKYQMKVYKSRGKGSQTKFLTLGMLTEIDTFEPSFDLISKYEKATKHLYEKQMIIVNENKKLKSLRDWLLPMLMNGQVIVTDT